MSGSLMNMMIRNRSSISLLKRSNNAFGISSLRPLNGFRVSATPTTSVRCMSSGYTTPFDIVDPAKLMSYHGEDNSYGKKKTLTSSVGTGSVKSSTATSARFSTKTSTSLPHFLSDDSMYGTSETRSEGCRRWTPQLTKIVATIGPTSEQFDMLQPVVRAGMRIMRLNFSHATVEEVELRMKNLHACKGRHDTGLPERLLDGDSINLRATLLDTRGPEVRMGKLRDDESGHETIQLNVDETVTLHTNTHWRDVGSTNTDLFIDYPKLHECVEEGFKILLDDGAVILTVKKINSKNNSVECHIDNSGELRSRAGVNLPGAETDLPAITEKDKNDIRYGLTKDIDYIAASFIQNAEGVRDIRRFVRDTMINDMKMDPASPPPLIISKIESVSGLRNFDEILQESDGIMVARGDLGVEIPIQQVTNAQKEMVAACNAVGKPVIVATQMLESMAKNPRPTRAEVADVTNAVYDGADCVMTSGETAKGKYPVETIKMMNEIILGAERFARARPEIAGSSIRHLNDNDSEHGSSSLIAVAKAAVTAAEERDVAAILVATTQGHLPRLVASFRPNVPIVAFCPSAKVGRQLIVHRGIHPVVGLLGTSVHQRPFAAIKDAKAMGFVESGDDVIVVSVDGSSEGMGMCAIMKIATVPSDEEM